MNFSFNSRVLVIGITEPLGLMYAPLMKAYGTQIVAGVSPGQGGQTLHGIRIYDMVEPALAHWGIVDTAVIFVPPNAVLDAALEAIAAGIQQLVLITAGVPSLDMVALLRKAEMTETLVIGSNSPGIIVPGQILLGTHPSAFYTPGRVGIVSRSGTLTYEVALELTRAGLGQSIAVGVGGDQIVGSSLQQWLQILEEDDQTDVIVVIGEAGGESEEFAAHYIAEAIDKPVVAYMAGRSEPSSPSVEPGTVIAARLAGLGSDVGTVSNKIAAFRQASIPIAARPSQVPALVKQALQTA